MAIVEQRADENEGERPQDLHRHAEDLAGEDPVGPALVEETSAIDFDCVSIRISPRSMKFMPSVAISDDRSA